MTGSVTRPAGYHPRDAKSTVPCWLCDVAAVLSDEYLPALLYRCGGCGFVFQPELSREELRENHGDEYFRNYGAGESYSADEHGRRHQARLRLRLMRRHSPPPGRLLEVGSAGGYFLDEARQIGYDVVGLEGEPSIASSARAAFDVPVITGFLEEAPLDHDAYDAVCGWHVLEHIPAPMSALDRVREALRPGGHFFVEVPNLASTEARRRGARWSRLDLGHHVGHYGPGPLAHALERAGLEVIAIDTVAMFSYFRPSVALRPLPLARRARLSLGARLVGNHHPWKHELLRAVARRPQPRDPR